MASLDNYLGKFQDVVYYRGSPCFNGTGGCSDAERAAMEEHRRLASKSQKVANDTLFKTLENQEKVLRNDARNLEQLQGAAQGAQGQLQAISYGQKPALADSQPSHGSANGRRGQDASFVVLRYAEFYGVQSFVKYRYGMEDKDGTITPNSI